MRTPAPRMAEGREYDPLEIGQLDSIPPFRDAGFGDGPRHVGNPRTARLPARAFLGAVFFATAAITHLIFFRRAKRDLGL